MSNSHNKPNEIQKPLPNTAYAVLGLLSLATQTGEVALSGYDVRKWAESLRFFYWSPAQSQIYSELRRLQKLGLVISKEVVQSGKPNKRLYEITEQGESVFREWVNKMEIEPTVMKHGLALRLFFGHAADQDRLVVLLEQFIASVEESLAQLAIVQEYTENSAGFDYPALVAEWGINYYQAELLTAQKILQKIR